MTTCNERLAPLSALRKYSRYNNKPKYLDLLRLRRTVTTAKEQRANAFPIHEAFRRPQDLLEKRNKGIANVTALTVRYSNLLC